MKAENKRFVKVMRLAVAERWNGVNTKEEFALALGEHPQHVYGIGTGTRNVTLKMLGSLYKVFGVSADYIVNGVEPMKLDKANSIESRLRKLEKQAGLK